MEIHFELTHYTRRGGDSKDFAVLNAYVHKDGRVRGVELLHEAPRTADSLAPARADRFRAAMRLVAEQDIPCTYATDVWDCTEGRALEVYDGVLGRPMRAA